MLRQLRAMIRSCAPEAEERLSYRMPYYHYRARLTYFAAFSKHVSMYVMGRSKHRFAREMRPYQTGAATLRFPIGTAIPAGLVKKLIRARVREIDQANQTGSTG